MCIRVHPWLILPPICEILAILRVLIEWPRMDTDAHGSESDVTEAVIGSAFEVANVLGAGFLEKVRSRARSCWRPRQFSVNLCSRVKHVCLRRLDTSDSESRRTGRFSCPRLSNGHGAAGRERLRGATELDGRTGPSEHDGPARHQGAPPRPERKRKSPRSRQLRRVEGQSLSRPARCAHVEERPEGHDGKRVVGSATPGDRGRLRARSAGPHSGRCAPGDLEDYGKSRFKGRRFPCH